MNILYLGDINSIHDFKWISFFSKKEEHKVYFVTEKENYALLTSSWRSKLKNAEIFILNPIHNFSLSNPIKSKKSINQLNQYIDFYDIDFFHVLFGSPQAIWLNFMPNSVKKVVTTRGSDVLVLLKDLISSKKIRDIILKKLLISGLKRADFLVSTSSRQIELLVQSGIVEGKCHLIKTGVDCEKIQKQTINQRVKTSKEKFIFSARYIGPTYNMDYQIEAIKLLPASFLSTYSFLFVKKKGDESMFYKKFINSLNSINGLKYDICEGIKQNEMWSTLKASTLTYMVPLSDGTPNTALECMASKVPFIMGDLAYEKHLFEKVCLIADLKNPENLSYQIQKGAVDYPREYLELGFDKVKKFGNRDIEMSKLEKLYKSYFSNQEIHLD